MNIHKGQSNLAIGGIAVNGVSNPKYPPSIAETGAPV